MSDERNQSMLRSQRTDVNKLKKSRVLEKRNYYVFSNHRERSHNTLVTAHIADLRIAHPKRENVEHGVPDSRERRGKNKRKYLMLSGNIWLWIGFNLFIVAMLAFDLGVFHRKAHTVSIKEALTWSVVWIALAMAFNTGLYFLGGIEPALQFFTGYLIEKSLSVDNIFVFVLLFTSFQVPEAYQHRVLFWGVLGALIMRGILIALGSVLLATFHWIIYLFGAFLIVAGVRMALRKEMKVHPEQNPLLKLVRRILPMTNDYVGAHFIVRQAGRVLATPLLPVLMVVETTDLIFALDSIPAIFAVTQNTFIIYTSNVFAILGLRSLYFVFANAMSKFYYLKIGLAVILTFVGVKMLLADIYHIPTELALAVIAVVLTTVIVASVVRRRRLAAKEREATIKAHEDVAKH